MNRFDRRSGRRPWPRPCSPSPSPSPAQAAAESSLPDIVDTAVAAGSFKTLAAALQAAGLVETLKGPGPFTVFAPTDAAFAKLPAGTVEALLKDKQKLAAVLTYHVVAGPGDGGGRVKMKSAKTVQGGSARHPHRQAASPSTAPTSSRRTSWPATASSTSSTPCSCPGSEPRLPGAAARPRDPERMVE